MLKPKNDQTSVENDPLRHVGTLSVFLLGFVTLTGIYITLFYAFSFSAAHASVVKMSNHPIQNVMRSAHRYASALFIVTSLVHAYKSFGGRRILGKRKRQRWVTGTTATVLTVLAAVTGYWLIADERAGLIQRFTGKVLGVLPIVGELITKSLVLMQGTGSLAMLIVWFVHLGLTAVIGFFTWRHLRKSNLPWLAPPLVALICGGLIMISSIVLPVGYGPAMSPDRLEVAKEIDMTALYWLPIAQQAGVWVALAVSLALVVALVAPGLSAFGAQKKLHQQNKETSKEDRVLQGSDSAASELDTAKNDALLARAKALKEKRASTKPVSRNHMQVLPTTPIGKAISIGTAVVAMVVAIFISQARISVGLAQPYAQISVDHIAGSYFEPAAAEIGALDKLTVKLDGETLAEPSLGSKSFHIEQVALKSDSHHLYVSVHDEAGAEYVVFDQQVSVEEKQRLVIAATDRPPAPGVTDGQKVFESRTAGCTICHSTEKGEDRVGPSLYGIADRAETRVANQDAETYIRNSILSPDEYVVDGFPAGQMLPIYEEQLSARELDELLVYLLSLKEN